MRILLGHGSGSFGHVPARRYGTRQGVRTEQEWRGFVEVWREAVQLNRIVVDALGEAGLPAISLPPSSSTVACDGQVEAWNLAPVRRALEANLLPVVFGDVVFDSQSGGTILSTEDLFSHLADQLQPQRILLAGIEAGVWADFPSCTRLVEEITPASWNDLSATVGGSTATGCDRWDGEQSAAEPGAGRAKSKFRSVYLLWRDTRGGRAGANGKKFGDTHPSQLSVVSGGNGDL